jgi:8-oxo-dGTP pyrophosphatase MutT (NUDIX family)
VLSSFSPADAQQTGLRAEYLDYLAAHPDATSRDCAPAHVTASALVLDRAAGSVALMLHPKVGRWLQFGGHCEPSDRTLGGAAEREVTEESGLPGLRVVGPPARLDRHEVRCRPDGSSGVHLDVQYVVTASSRTPLVPSPESQHLRWFALDELPADTDGSVRALVAAALRSGPGRGAAR